MTIMPASVAHQDPDADAGHVFGTGQVALDRRLAMLASHITVAFLTEAGWDPHEQVLTVAPEHPLLGRTICRAPGCRTTCSARAGVCLDCRRRLASAGLSVDDYPLLPPPQRTHWLDRGEGTCTVTGCPRPWVRSAQPLCLEHTSQQHLLGVEVRAFTARADVIALDSYGVCAVGACPRELAAAEHVYCAAHWQRMRDVRRAGQRPDETVWRTCEPPVHRSGTISLAGLHPSVVVQILFGLQQRTRERVKTAETVLRPICDDARRQRVTCLEDLVIPARRGATYQSVVHTLILHANRGGSEVGTEIIKDTWDMALFGHRGRLSFTAISQPWLRQTAKIWAATDLPGRRGRTGGDKTRHYLSSLALLSDSLRQRPDHGGDPVVLGRADVHAFLARLAWLQATGRISQLTRVLACREVRRLLTIARQLGATAPGGPAAGLSDRFALHRDDIPAEPVHGEPGRDLPPEVVRQICEHLPTLNGSHLRTAVTILIDTGRRPDDALELPLDCLTTGSDGSPVLVYDNHKANRLARRLPLPEATADAIRAQQARVRARFPDTPPDQLKLLPTSWHNPDGRRALTTAGFSTAHRAWISSLPTLLRADGTPYDKARITPYGYRHSYAQRHADAGIPIDVLAELLDHRNLNVTRSYYRVGEDRRRSAVDKVTTMQFDRHGNRAWLQASPPAGDQHARYTIGAVAVPYGTCTEPSNVAAGGTDCPLRFRCAGCDHFRTDISYLPDLTAYLDDLLRTRERLAALDTAEPWATAAAAPPDEEIASIRHLIHRIKTEMNDLTPDERASIDEAVATVRKHRAVHLGMPQRRRPTP